MYTMMNNVHRSVAVNKEKNSVATFRPATKENRKHFLQNNAFVRLSEKVKALFFFSVESISPRSYRFCYSRESVDVNGQRLTFIAFREVN